jgi:hypothetical protein
MSAVAASEDPWLDGWDAAICAAAAVLSTSDLPIEIADHAVDLVNGLLTD